MNNSVPREFCCLCLVHMFASTHEVTKNIAIRKKKLKNIQRSVQFDQAIGTFISDRNHKGIYIDITKMDY